MCSVTVNCSTGYEVVEQVPPGTAPWTLSAPEGKFVVGWLHSVNPSGYERDGQGRITGLVYNNTGTDPIWIICVNG